MCFKSTIVVSFVLLAIAASGTLASVVYVDRNAPGPTHDGISWDTAYLKIQDGINAAARSDQIWVADGIYIEKLRVRGVRIYGGFLGAEPGGYESDLSQRDFVAHTTTINANKTGSCIMMAMDSVVDGFTIKNGKAGNGGGVCCSNTDFDPEHQSVIRNNVITGNTATECGGGIYCTTSSPIIENNVIIGNTATDRGGGISCDSSSPTIENNAITGNIVVERGGGISCQYSSPAIANNTFTDNTATGEYGLGGAIYCGSSDPTIENNTITGNSAYTAGGICSYDYSAPIIANNTITGNEAIFGGGIFCTYGSPTVTGNTITGNTATEGGGGIECFYHCETDISDNTIIGNSGGGGGGAVDCCYYCSTDITNNIIVGNEALAGSAIRCWDSCSATITNNTIVGNTATGSGGAVYCFFQSPLTINNNVIANNTAGPHTLGGGIRCDAESIPELACNDVWKNYPNGYSGCSRGAGDISEDPLFVDPGNGDHHLSIGSPCVDKGDNTALGLPDLDFEGEPRVFDGDGNGVATVDIGADESRWIVAKAPLGWFNLGWNYFSIPFDPVESAEASELLGFNCANILYRLNPVEKSFELYPNDFTDLACGRGYLLRLETDERPSYEAYAPVGNFEIALPEVGWTWIGQPFHHDTLLGDCLIRNNAVGVTRTAAEDRAASDSWINWNLIWWDSQRDSWTLLGLAGSGNEDSYLRPWHCYHVWSCERDLTLIVPEG